MRPAVPHLVSSVNAFNAAEAFEYSDKALAGATIVGRM